MDNQISISSKDTIFATGVFLQPLKCVVNNSEQWRWVAVNFEDDSFFDGEAINPALSAKQIDNLAARFDD